MSKTYTGLIQRLEPNQIFVFGSNTQGRHGAGAALVALSLFGAVYGQAYGRQGSSYAIVTKDLTKSIHPSINKYNIVDQIKQLYKYAEDNENLEFVIAYSGIGTNLNGYTPDQMAAMFAYPNIIPANIVFEEQFSTLVTKYLNFLN